MFFWVSLTAALIIKAMTKPLNMTPTHLHKLSPSKKTTNEPSQVEFLLLGGGVASAHAAQTLRQDGAVGRILIVSEENFAPYHRPPPFKINRSCH
jgi:hypothetical protein